MEPETLTEEQRQRAEANRLAALAKRRRALCPTNTDNQFNNLFKCRKIIMSNSDHIILQHKLPPSEKFGVRLEICSRDEFSIIPVPVDGIVFPGESVCLERISDCLSNILFSHYTQNHGGGKAGVYKLEDYDSVLRCLRNYKGIEIEEVPWGTLNVIRRISSSSVEGQWTPCRPEHLSTEKVDELIEKLPQPILDALLPFQLEGIKYGLQRGGRCLIADEMGLGKTLQAIAIAASYIPEGPILIVCPAILRFSWAEELERWLSVCLPSEIHLVFGHTDNPIHLRRFPKVVVISFTMLYRLRNSILGLKWALMIVDESHHVRCTKKKEPGEIQAVLDMATKVNHIVLLSGTPSLSRPFDIFHQINMLWPGLLGKDKYDFAKTYCAVISRRVAQGKIIQDFSRGVRLEELNILLKQTVMIRRLKKHVLVQLPPKRRQIISLQLKKSDIILALTIVHRKEYDDLNDDREEKPSNISDKPDDSRSCPRSSMMLSEQEIGVAKLSGFFEWLSMHPIFADSDDADDPNLSLSCPKMIIFAHHHNVLNGVQEFICDKGIGFVRIDGTTLARDRQSAVKSFQSSKEIKVAIIGITAACVGLDLSSANHVVFIELPRDPSHMCQAEDRAHRRGQTKAVNIYIFCAKNTSDESRWKTLNKSLHRITSTSDGKYDSIQEIEVDSVTYLNACEGNAGSSTYSVLEGTSAAKSSAVELMQFSTIEPKLDLQPSEAYDDIAKMKSKRTEDQMNGITSEDESSHDEERDSSGDFEDESEGPELNSSRGSDEANKDEYHSTDMQEDIVMTQKILEVIGAHSSPHIQVECLRFEVSRYTGRVHLYSCIPGIDLRPKPLFENFRPEECESPKETSSDKISDGKSIKDNPAYRPALLAFIDEWNNLKPIQRNSLLGKPLQLPLSIELCYLKESPNHDSRGLLKGRSKRRTTPSDEIAPQLPLNAEWKKVRLAGFSRKKEKEFVQGWTASGEPLCKLCNNPCLSRNAKAPEFFEDLFCNLSCYEEFRLRTSNRFLRQELFEIEHGVCANCQLDCHKLVQIIKPLSVPLRQKHIEMVAPKLAGCKKLLDKLLHDPIEGNAWHADHVVAVYQGGGECRLQNMRTLCVACHADVTAAQRADRRSMRIKAKEQIKLALNDLVNVQKVEQTDSSAKFQGQPLPDDDDDLFVHVPGSAYSFPTNEVNNSEKNEKSCSRPENQAISCENLGPDKVCTPKNQDNSCEDLGPNKVCAPDNQDNRCEDLGPNKVCGLVNQNNSCEDLGQNKVSTLDYQDNSDKAS